MDANDSMDAIVLFDDGFDSYSRKFAAIISENASVEDIAMKNNVKKEKSHKYQERHDIGEKYKKIFAEAVGE